MFTMMSKGTVNPSKLLNYKIKIYLQESMDGLKSVSFAMPLT